MPTTATELNGNLVIDFGDGTSFTVHPVPGKIGIEIQSLLVGVGSGVTMYAQGPEQHEANAERLAILALGLPTKKRKQAPNRRATEFNNLRAARQAVVVQAATLWNAGGGGIDAVNDLLEEAGGYPKALARVMESSGLGDGFKALQTWLNGEGQELNSETDSSASTTTQPGTSSTSV